MSSILRVTVREIAIADFLGLNFPAWALPEIASALRGGQIRLNGRRFTGQPNQQLTHGDTLTLHGPAVRAETPAQDTPLPLEILYQDAALLIINKPSGMLSHPSPQEKSGTLLHAAAHYLLTSGAANLLRPLLLHRLDRDTSGVIALARTAPAARRLNEDFEQRRVAKHYLAVVKGIVAPDSGTIEAPIAATPHLWPRWRIASSGQGQPAQTRFTVAQRGPQHTLLRLEPLTGRTHQLRLHCAYIGHPILGERIYRGTQPSARGPHNTAPRSLLHAHRLILPHPTQPAHQSLETVAPYPADFAEAMTAHGLNGPP